MRRRAALSALTALSLSAALPSCRAARRAERKDGGKLSLVVKYQPLGESDAFQRLLRAFERQNAGVTVVAEALPTSSDVAHQFFLTALEGESQDFDVFVVNSNAVR